MQKKFCFTIIVLLLVTFSSCKKYLDVKPLKSLAVPATFTDLQALLDKNDVMNGKGSDLIALIDDDYYVQEPDYLSSSEEERLNYVWDKSAYYKEGWNTIYQGAIYSANVVLDQLPKINATGNTTQYNNIKGSALFHRAFAFYEAAQLFCKPYSNTAQTDPGIVLRLTAAIEMASVRSTVQQTYDQIINDVKEAIDLLPNTTQYPTQPTKAAGYGLLARTYLSMRDYVDAGHYADLCLQQNNNLMDFNTLIPLMSPSIHRFNKETIFHHFCFAVSAIVFPTYAKIDTTLYASYDVNDLRKQVFFYEDQGSAYFQGSYEPDYLTFDGIATDEMYLIRAECFARAGNTSSAINDLNTLLRTRWLSGTFIDYTAPTAANALNIILTERRKELVERGLRWTDLRRFNLEGANITLKRIIGANTYTLPPNDPRWALLIPTDVIERSGVQQNPR
jgi:tetratricopeptide (TPR) repeat protein